MPKPISTQVEVDMPAPEVSEDAIANAFAEKYAGNLLFDHNSGRWFEWEGDRWVADETARGLHYAREIMRRMGEGKKSMSKASVAKGAELFARADPRLAATSKQWDADKWLLGTPGGTINLLTGKLLPAKPDHFITKQTATTPQAGEPTRWLEFLDEATRGDAEVINFLQEWCGYGLTGDTREHALLFVHGGGGNGKSVFINTFTRLLGDYAVTAAMETFTASRGEKHSTDIAMLKGARLVTASETEEGKAWAESRIKQMTGADPITARFMRRDNFTYVPQFKLTIVGNHAPVMHNVDEAMRRRFRIVPFDNKPTKPDRMLEEKLVREWPQILAWMIAGCLRWQEHGLSHPRAMQDATAAYFEAQDVFGQWIEVDCNLGLREWDETGKLYESWCRFARSSGEEAGSQKRFNSMMQKRGFMPSRMPGGTRQRIFKGVALKPHDYDPDQGYPV